MTFRHRKADITFRNAAGDLETLEGLEVIGTWSYRRKIAGREATYFRASGPGGMLLEHRLAGRVKVLSDADRAHLGVPPPRQLGRIVSIELQPEERA